MFLLEYQTGDYRRVRISSAFYHFQNLGSINDPTNNKIFSESGCFSELYCFDVEFCSLLYKIIVLYLKLIQCFMFTFMLVVIIRHRVGLKYFPI